MKKPLFFTTVILIFCISGFICHSAYSFREHAASTGRDIGAFNGKIVGNAVGSVKGYTTGYAEGKEAGAKAGLSAEDTDVNILETVTSVGKLEVLSAGVTMKNITEIGDTYKGLFVINGDAIFTVDLTEAVVQYGTNKRDVFITIPQPELTLFLDADSTQKLAEEQNFSISVDAEDGLNAHLNGLKRVTEDVQNTISNYESLVSSAEESAINQVTQLVCAVYNGSGSISVKIQRGE